MRKVKERRSLSSITISPSLIEGRGIKGEGYLIKTILSLEIASALCASQ